MVSRVPSTHRLGAALVALVAMSLVTACDDDETLSLDEAAEVDNGAVAGGDGSSVGLFGTADVTFDGVTASIGAVECRNEGHLEVTPIVSDSFTLIVAGDPDADTWNVRVTQPGDPEVEWTAAAPTVDLDGDALAGSAQMQRVDDPTVTAPLAFVIDC